MRRILLAVLAVLFIAGCSRLTSITQINVFDEHDYQWHKVTLNIKVHWSYKRPDPQTIVAEGYVEPFDPKTCLNHVRLELVGLDADGNVVNSAKGKPADELILQPNAASYFRIQMKLNGKEKDFNIRGSYHYFLQGTNPNLSNESLANIPLRADEPY
jgi:hypothetical protein